MVDFVTVAQVKQYMGTTSAAYDALLASLVTACSAAVANFCNREISSTRRTETYSGRGGLSLSLNNWPVTAVHSVTVNGISYAASAGYGQPGYRFDSGRVILEPVGFTKGLLNVVVDYTAGYAVIPQEIQQAALETVALKFRQRDHIGFTSKSLAGESVAYSVDDIPDSAQSALESFRRRTWTLV